MNVLRTFGMGKSEGKITKQLMDSAQGLVELFGREKQKPFNPELALGMVTCNVPSTILFGKQFDYDDKAFHETIETIGYVMQNLDSAGMKA